VEYLVAYGTLIGKRQNQEDCLFLNGEIVQEEACEVRAGAADEALFCAVCDGMGGHAMGEWASRFVCERLREGLFDPPATPGRVAALLGGIQAAMERERPKNCGTTVAGVLLAGARALVFNAGDSRVYKITPAGLARLSHDHSLVQNYVDRGELAPGEVFRHPHRNVIEFGLGDVFASAWAAGTHAVHCRENELGPGERYLLCSDGLHDVLEEGEIAALCAGPGATACATALLAAVRGRISDNTSLIVIEAV
jgi:serine/threonine protein phosphatase PrpC